jgi:putative phage-type endonuclease
MDRPRLGIGGSDAPVIAGLSPWKSPVQLWAERLGIVEPSTRETPEMRWGTILERVVLDAYEETTGRRVRRPRRLLWHPEVEWMFGSLDGLTGRGRSVRVVEAKTARHDRGWGGSPVPIPAYYYCQVQHYIAVTRAAGADVAVLIAGSDFRVYGIDRDQDYIDALIELEAEFVDALRNRREPDLDGAEGTSRYLAERYAKASGEEKVATPEQEALVEELVARVEAAEAAERAAEEARNRVKAVLGSATVLWTPRWKVAWTPVSRAGTVDWRAVAEGYRQVALRLDPGVEQELEAVVAANQSSPSSYRRFTVTPVKGGPDDVR